MKIARARTASDDAVEDEPRIGRDGKTRHPLAVTDPRIRKQLQLAGLRFLCTRARWLESEATIIGKALKAGEITSAEADAKIDELGALDLVYPELMGFAE